MNNIIVPERPYPPLPANQFADARFESSRYGDGREANELSFGSILSMLWQHRILFCVCFAVVFAAAAVVILQLQPSYRSEAMLMVDERPPNITNLQSIRSAPL